MASFEVVGDVKLGLSLAEIAEIPDAVMEEMVMAGAEITKAAHKAKLRELKLYDSDSRAKQHLVDSVTAFKKVGRDENGRRRIHAVVYPAGKRGTRKRRKVTKVYKNSKSGREYTFGGDTKDVTQAEVAFIHHYGAPKRHIPATKWMDKANDSCADAVASAELAVYDRFLESKNL